MKYLEYLEERRHAIKQSIQNTDSMHRQMELMAVLKEINSLIALTEGEPYDGI